jgi:hypothetical protein
MAMSLDVCCEIQKFPNLLAHFAEHKALDGDSVFEFVVEDYIDHGSGSNHHDENSHEDLPFHGNHTCSHAPIYFSSAPSFLVIHSDAEKTEARSFYRIHFISPALGHLFQPPQS